ncbi:hypothetical protein J6P92_00815 [bacterium]|nr:hypothetical protein [bacterium]
MKKTYIYTKEEQKRKIADNKIEKQLIETRKKNKNRFESIKYQTSPYKAKYLSYTNAISDLDENCYNIGQIAILLRVPFWYIEEELERKYNGKTTGCLWYSTINTGIPK